MSSDNLVKTIPLWSDYYKIEFDIIVNSEMETDQNGKLVEIQILKIFY